MTLAEAGGSGGFCGAFEGFFGVRWPMLPDPRPLLFALWIGAALLVGCSSGAGGSGGSGGSGASGGAAGSAGTAMDVEWSPTRVPYDPSCASDCEVVEEGNYGHIGELQLLVNPDIDDPIAQWGDCIESFTVCIDNGMDAQSCSEGSVCPEECRVEYEERLVGLSDLEAQLLAFQAVYIDEGARCVPPIAPVDEGSP